MGRLTWVAVAGLLATLAPSAAFAEEQTLKQNTWEVTLGYDPAYTKGALSDFTIKFKNSTSILQGLRYNVNVRVFERARTKLDDAVEGEGHDPQCASCRGRGCDKRVKRKVWDFAFDGDEYSSASIAGRLALKVDWSKYANGGKAEVFVRIVATASRDAAVRVDPFENPDKCVVIKEGKDEGKVRPADAPPPPPVPAVDAKADLTWRGGVRLDAKSVAPGGELKAKVTLWNTGRAKSGAFAVSYYLSVSRTYFRYRDDVLLVKERHDSLDAGGQREAETTLRIPASVAPGDHYGIGIAIDEDSEASDSDRTNNTYRTPIEVVAPKVAKEAGGKIGSAFAGEWGGTVAGYPATLWLVFENDSWRGEIRFHTKGASKETLSGVDVRGDAFRAVRPKDNNAELVGTFRTLSGDLVLEGDYVDAGTKRPIKMRKR